MEEWLLKAYLNSLQDSVHAQVEKYTVETIVEGDF